MNKEASKKAFREAEKELEEKQIKKLKEVIKRTLQRIEAVEKLIKELTDEKKILKLDIEDLKEGRLDRIEERQKKDDKAKQTSVVKIQKVKEIHHHYDRWYEPYKVTWVTPRPHYFPNEVFCLKDSSHSIGDNLLDATLTTNSGSAELVNESFTLNNSVSHNHAIGTYALGCKTVHLR